MSSRNPVETRSKVTHGFRAVHPDGSVFEGSWTTKENAEYEALSYSKDWLANVKRLGLAGQRVRIEMQTRTEEVRVFVSKPVLAREYSHLSTDHYGNYRGIS